MAETQTAGAGQPPRFTRVGSALADPDKCLVRDCPNTRGGGEFVGPLCRPCATALAGDFDGSYSIPARERIKTSIFVRGTVLKGRRRKELI